MSKQRQYQARINAEGTGLLRAVQHLVTYCQPAEEARADPHFEAGTDALQADVAWVGIFRT